MSAPSTLVLGLGLVFASMAHAEESYPNLMGTWSGTADGVFVTAPGPQTDATYRTIDITLVIDRQEDRRFNGTITIEGATQQMVGIVTDEGGIRWSEPGGFVEGRLTDPNTLKGCYVRVSLFSQLAACEELKRRE